MKKYRLLKDTPNHKVGTIFILNGGWTGNGHCTYYQNEEGYQKTIYTKQEVEGQPEWFELVEEKPEKDGSYNIFIAAAERMVGERLFTLSDMEKCY